MKNYALDFIQKMQPYCPPLSGRNNFNGVLLDFNERTIPVNPRILKALQDYLNQKKTQLYPEYFDLTAKIAKYASCPREQIMITNAVDQGIDLVFKTFTQKNDPVIIPAPSFQMFFQCAQICGTKISSPTYQPKTLKFPFNEVLNKISSKTKLIVLCNPNNPTGTLIDLEQIEQIASTATNAIILIDEAYYEFSQVTAVPLLKKYPNIIILRTFSKAFGLAGLRIGFIITAKENITELLKVRGPYDINTLAEVAASAALEEVQDATEYANEVMTKAKPLLEAFLKKHKITYYPSWANFVLIKIPEPERILAQLKEKGYLIRPRQGKNIENTLRITVGTIKQMKKFIKAFQEIL